MLRASKITFPINQNLRLIRKILPLVTLKNIFFQISQKNAEYKITEKNKVFFLKYVYQNY